ncbi:MAG: hypothetical protein K9H25_05655 [Rhodospirillum sp.]|nr:hypothetical protein [Rhodospirillum sp.]MCF8488975.1 hypothetical protein [Rhodospirillum sp.]MCF8500016.1 hypothetical protein [Rhodospirillum sp.]
MTCPSPQSTPPVDPLSGDQSARSRQLEATLALMKWTEREMRAHVRRGDRRAALATAAQALEVILRGTGNR